MSITPNSPALIKQGQVQTWVTSRWKNPSIPGQLSAEINIEADASEQMLLLTWKEAGGPPVAEPIRRSFGSRLIQLGLVGKGDAEKRYLPDGLVATFRSSLKDIREL